MRVALGVLLWLVLAASAMAQSVTLAWDANTETDLAGYKVYWGVKTRTYSNAPVPTVAPSTTPTYTVTGLTPGTTYYFAVTAYNTALLESMYSNEVSTTIPQPGGDPDPPLNLTLGFVTGPLIVDLTGTTAQLAWKTRANMTSRIEYSYEGGTFQSVPVSTTAVTDHYIILRNLVAGKIYGYEVICEMADGTVARATGSFQTRQ